MEHPRNTARAGIAVAIAIALSALSASGAMATPVSEFTPAPEWKGVRVVAHPLTHLVHYDDLALATKAGRKSLMHRVKAAVSEVCPAYDEHGDAYDVQYCSDFAWAGARPQIKRAVRLARSGQTLAMTIEITAAAAK